MDRDSVEGSLAPDKLPLCQLLKRGNSLALTAMGGSYIMKTSTKLHKGEALERARQEGEKRQEETLLQQIEELQEHLLKQQWELETEYFYYSIQCVYLLVKHMLCL